ncbi:HAAS signaling domain-containing protein [Nocardioides lijunqiniae]|uniref:HAAS signaling domain-containing protein n=1 Tax=Nocardioides lijunqiniae TaxID=2760832 RepID=UPI00187878ED|nr:hypothetical protein [Nocardioides lijunqiniae]
MNDDSTTDLVERYLAAVSRRLPEAIRADVTDELRGTIADMRDAHGDDPAATREVLLELGDPAVLARSYDTRPRHLIDPAVFDDFVGVLRATLVTVLPIVLVAMTVVQVGIEGESLPLGLLHAALDTFTVGLHIVFWTGLAFALVERYGDEQRAPATDEQEPWSPDLLPPVPPQRQIGVSELVWGLVVVAASIAWLPWQHLRGVVDDADGDPVPLVDPALWDSWIPAFIVIMLAGGVLEVVKYRVGRWTLPLVLVNAALNAVLAAFVVVVMTVVGVENPDFAPAMLADDNVWEPRVVGTVVLATILALCAWDVVASVRQHLLLRRDAAATPATGRGRTSAPA